MQPDDRARLADRAGRRSAAAIWAAERGGLELARRAPTPARRRAPGAARPATRRGSSASRAAPPVTVARIDVVDGAAVRVADRRGSSASERAYGHEPALLRQRAADRACPARSGGWRARSTTVPTPAAAASAPRQHGVGGAAHRVERRCTATRRRPGPPRATSPVDEPARPRPPLVGAERRAARASRSSSTCAEVDGVHAVDQRLVGLGEHRDPAVLEALDEVDLPQRPVPVQRPGDDPGHQLAQLVHACPVAAAPSGVRGSRGRSPGRRPRPGWRACPGTAATRWR